jgi:hypothetical protein
VRYQRLGLLGRAGVSADGGCSGALTGNSAAPTPSSTERGRRQCPATT